MECTYRYQVYDDLFHITKCHQHELESITNYGMQSYKLKTCDISTCSFSDRHFRVNRIKHDNEEYKYFTVYSEIMDNIHFYLHHLHQNRDEEYQYKGVI